MRNPCPCPKAQLSCRRSDHEKHGLEARIGNYLSTSFRSVGSVRHWVVQFAENMSSGRGWVAVVAVMLGRAHPVGVLAACALFALAEALGFRFQGNGLPVQITDALPFVVTLLALVVARKRFARLLDLTTAG